MSDLIHVSSVSENKENLLSQIFAKEFLNKKDLVNFWHASTLKHFFSIRINLNNRVR